ncbi:hypothetical protein DPV78_000440 [Talaromyces pinophilus]|nr:hypothetical protein DPV78_000440 [Talaromyces pinophilus]
MSTQNTPLQNTKNGPIAIKAEDQQQSTLNQQLQSIDWDSEQQLISSLAKLQELESKIHELRSLLPDRLLAPLNPIINPRRLSPASFPSANTIPRNPQALSALLRKSAVEGVAEINSFKELWTSADMASIWHRVDEKLAETKGAFPQDGAVGVWRVEYADLLREADEQEKKDGKGGGGGREVVEEVDDEAQFPASVYGTKEDTASPKKIIESFQARGIPGFRVASTRNESTIIVSLGLAGLTFEIQEALTTSETTTSSSSDGTTSTSNATSTNRSLPEWRVEARQNLPLSKSAGAGAGTGASRLENAIVSQLNSRARKWDLRFLLELILSYADIRSLPCKKCGQLTDSMAQLPILRRAVVASSAAGTAAEGGGSGTGEGGSAAGTATGNGEGVVWEGYHVGCI